MSQLDAAMLHISRNRQLFLDNLILEQVQDVTRTIHKPQKVNENPLVGPDKPWEEVTYFACNAFQVVYDAKDDKFKCLYTDYHWDAEEYARRRSWTDTDISLMRQAYAESDDGIHWIKPNLGRVTENGRDTNLVWGGGETGTIYCNAVIEDPHAEDEDHRWKCTYVHEAPGLHTIEAGYSRDLINWTPYEQLPTFGTRTYLNDVMTMAYDPYSRNFIMMTREPIQAYVPPIPGNPRSETSFFSPHYPHDMTRMNKRRIWQCISHDFLHWSHPMIAFQPDEEDNIDDSFYGMHQFFIGGQRVGFVNVLHEAPNTTDTRLAHSRDDHVWKWVDRQPWLERGKPGSHEENMVVVPTAPIVRGDEIYIFYGGSKNHHDWWMTGVAEGLECPEATDRDYVGYYLCLAKLRLDGFVSIDTSPVRDGYVTTRPLFHQGDRLFINAKVQKGGFVKVQLADMENKVLEGYTFDDCDPFDGDAVHHMVTWKGKREVPGGAMFKVNFHMRKASLYAFQFTTEDGAESSIDPQIDRAHRWRKWE